MMAVVTSLIMASSCRAVVCVRTHDENRHRRTVNSKQRLLLLLCPSAPTSPFLRCLLPGNKYYRQQQEEE